MIEAIKRWIQLPRIEEVILGTIFLATVAFVVNVNDGTFAKPLVLYGGCGIILTLMLSRTFRTGHAELTWSRFHTIYGLFFLAGVLSLLRGANVRLGLEALVQQTCFFVLFVVASSQLNVRRSVSTFIMLASTVSFVALAHHLIPSSSNTYQTVLQFAKISTLGNQSYFAGFLVFLIPIVVARIASQSEFNQKSALLVLLAGVLAYLLIMTESRSAWAASVISLCCFVAMNSERRKFLLLGFVSLCLLLAGLYLIFRDTIEPRILMLFNPGPQSSVMRRLFFYSGAWRAFLASPLIGNGIGNFVVFLPRFRSSDYWMFRSEDVVPHAHSEFLEVLSETGFMGLCSLLILLFLFFKVMVPRQRAMTGKDRVILAGFLSSIAGVLIDNLWSMNLRTIPVACCFWIVAGLCLRWENLQLATQVITTKKSLALSRIMFGVVIVVGGYFLFSAGLNRYFTEKYYLKGLLLQTEGREDDASIEFKKVLSINDHHAESLFYLSVNYVEQGEYDSAGMSLGILFHERPYYPKMRTLQAICALERGYSARAFELIQQELVLNRSSQILYYASIIGQRINREEDEIEYLQEILDLNIKSGLTDFGLQALQRLGEIRVESLNRGNLRALFLAYREKFSGDTILVRESEKNLTSLAVGKNTTDSVK